MIQYYSITIDEINRDQHIYDAPIILKKNMDKQSNPENHATNIPLPLHIAIKNKDIKLYMYCLC